VKKDAKKDTAEVYYTNGNWVTGHGCFHCDPSCCALQLATTGVSSGTATDAKARGLQPCRRCTVRKPAKSLQDELSSTVNSESTEVSDCENYMFSVTASTDVPTAIMSSMDTVQEATLFKDCELVYCVEDTGNYHVNKTGYFWLVCELPELKH
jgi:hypothetical protein